MSDAEESMVEGVARAIYEATGPSLSWEHVATPRKRCRDQARAAIAAMREPTEAMRAAQDDCLKSELGGLHDSAYWSEGWPKELWTSMIDAALATAASITTEKRKG